MVNRSIMRVAVGIVLLVMCTAFFSGTVLAEEKQFYVGVGGSYIFPNLAYEDAVDWDSYSWGVNAKFGYRLARTLYLQLDVDYIIPIDGALRTDTTIGGDVEMFTGMVSLKGYFPQFTVIRPYVIAGAGVMHYNVDYNAAAQSSGFPLPDDNETDLCFKVGGGVDFSVSDAVSFGIEGNYTGGLEQVEDVEYIQVGAGIAFHF